MFHLQLRGLLPGGSMEMLIVLIVGCVVATPIIAIVALVKTGTLRERLQDQSDRVVDLESEVAILKRQLAKLAAGSFASKPEVAEDQVQAGVAAQREYSSETITAVEQKSSAAAPNFRAAMDGVASSPETAAASAEATMRFLVKVVEESQGTIPSLPLELVEAGTVSAEPDPVGTPARKREEANGWEPQVPPPFASQAIAEPAAPRRTWRERLGTALPLEEVLGMNFFAKIGIVLLVLGVAFWGRLALATMGPGERVAMIYSVSAAMLGVGVWFERKERYRLVGRTGIGGGWALLFFTTYALHNVSSMTVLNSSTLDCLLMLLVAAGMVGHTLRYKSQLVTGLAFLLAFSTVALSQNTIYSLSAGVILALGIVAIALRMSWFELEIFGIAASFGNHFYWLYKLYPHGVAGHPFPEFWPSTVILLLYWAIFRGSYVARKIRSVRDESLSTLAALLNTTSLLAVMKFQSTHPELAFFALVALGLVEFALGQLPTARRRRAAFVLLSVLGTILVFVAVPFKFSGNNIALLWMVAAEVLLLAGISQREKLFRRLGLLGGAITGVLILYGAWQIIEIRMTSSQRLTRDGVLLLACSVLFYGNAYWLRRKWTSLFAGPDQWLATSQSYLGMATAFLGTWAVLTSDWTAIGWAALLLATAWGKRYWDDNHLLAQAAALALAVVAMAYGQNLHLGEPYPKHVVERILTLPLIALAFYAAAWLLSHSDDLRSHVKQLCLWAGTAVLVGLAWMEVKPTWVGLVWAVLAAVLSLEARRFRIADLTSQEHLLAAVSAGVLVILNLDAATAVERYVPMVGAAAVFYAISRTCTLKDVTYARPAAWAHTWVATGFIAALAWHESPQPWLAVIWAAFALALALADRWFGIEELPWQAHLLAALSVARTTWVNLEDSGAWHNMDLRLITVVPVIAVLYALARWVRMPDLRSDARNAYTWTAAAVFGWLLWAELQPVAVAVGLAVLGLALFEIGDWRDSKHLRIQAYALFATSFGRIFFANLTASAGAGEVLGPRVYTVVPIALIFFFVWTRLQSKTPEKHASHFSPATLLAYLGTISIVALIYFEVWPEWVVVAWAAAVLALMSASLLLKKEVFLHQAELLAAGLVVRALVHNIYGGSYFTAAGWRGSVGVMSATSGLLLAILPLAFRLQKTFSEIETPRLMRAQALRHPEQVFFFAPSILMAFVIAVRMNPGMITLAWGVEGLLMILLGLITSQRSYRLAGLGLLSLCVGKIVARDAWRLEARDRYITFIVLGAALTLVSALYGKYRETVRRLL